jgi:hypothetical protein
VCPDRRAIPPRAHSFVWRSGRGLHRGAKLESPSRDPTIQRCYARFLEESNNPDDREYTEEADQIREVIIHAHYLSQKDIEICAAFDWQGHEELEMHTNARGIESLHQTLRATYTEPEAAAAT